MKHPDRGSSNATPLVLFTGGKGGVGKTLLAVNTALELARRRHRVLLVDLDLGLADVDVLLSLQATRRLEDALVGGVPLAECVVRGPEGLAVLTGSSGSLGVTRMTRSERERFFARIAELAREYDVVIADSAAGIGPEVLEACIEADHVFVVTTPEPTALTDAYGLIKALHTRSEEEGREVPTPELVVNQSKSLEEAEFTAAKLRSVCERFLARSPRSAGWMPSSTAVARSAAMQRPFALDPDGGLPWSCLARLATRLERLCLGAPAGAPAQGAWSHGR